jgi:oligopeptide/dipeptide ABC transporter ATP-binding protein
MTDGLLEAVALRKTFANGVRAVDGVDLRIAAGETVGVVGESGCGKSTTAKLLLRLLDADGGDVRFEGEDLLRARGSDLRRMRGRLQFVPQSPALSLNPRLTISSSICFNLRAQGWPKRDRGSRVDELLSRVGLTPRHGERYPHELSGGQLQRAALARALATNPSLVVCDEAVSALDKSIQAQVLNLLAELQADSGVAYLFISHDLAVVEHISDVVAVMYLGRVVERGRTADVLGDPLHPYTQALLSSAPGFRGERTTLTGSPPSAADPPSGCTFRTRCPHAGEACAKERPPLGPVAPEHWVACTLHPPRRPIDHSLSVPAPS